MKVDILASGSSGNCIALTSNETTILVDAGIAKTKIEKALLEVGIKATDVKGIFVTHAHKDHTKGLPLANKYKIPVYAAADEWKDIQSVDEELQRESERMQFGDFCIEPFKTYHDAYAPLGYSIISDIMTDKECRTSICLDTGKVDREMLTAMKNSDIYIIEANHEPKMVEASSYPNSVKARVLSDVGHLSNQQTAEALSQLVKGKGEQIYLTHLSSNNNMPALAEMTVVRALNNKGFRRNIDYKLEVK